MCMYNMPKVISIVWFPFPNEGFELFQLKNCTEYLVTLRHMDGFRSVTAAYFYTENPMWHFKNDLGGGIPVGNYGYTVIAYAQFPFPYVKNK